MGRRGGGLLLDLVAIATCWFGLTMLTGCNTVTVTDPAVPVFHNVRELAEASSVIVIGVPQSQNVLPASEHVGDSMVTVVKVETVLKASIELNSYNTVVVNQPISRPDASYPPILAIDFRYLLYLAPEDKTDPSPSVFLVVGPGAGQWIASNPSNPTLFTSVAPDPINNLPTSLSKDSALG